MMMHKIIPSVDNNYWLKRFNTKLNEPTNQNSSKLELANKRKHFSKTLETSVINSKTSPSLPG